MVKRALGFSSIDAVEKQITVRKRTYIYMPIINWEKKLKRCRSDRIGKENRKEDRVGNNVMAQLIKKGIINARCFMYNGKRKIFPLQTYSEET